jgi:hypothetical protein
MTRPMYYVDPPDVPEGMTLGQYRAQGCVAREARTVRGALRRWLRLGLPPVPADRAPAPRA